MRNAPVALTGRIVLVQSECDVLELIQSRPRKFTELDVSPRLARAAEDLVARGFLILYSNGILEVTHFGEAVRARSARHGQGEGDTVRPSGCTSSARKRL